ncbi:unnamed protein product [Amaranthus hypochondriacus]
MKLLTWMHRKFRQGNGETMKEFPIGQPLLDDSTFCQKQNQGKHRRASFTSIETEKYIEFERKTSSAYDYPEYFEGFLAIGTLGMPDAVISEPETPTFAMSLEKLTDAEAEVSENELRIINDELERVLAAEAKDDGWTDSSGRNSHVSNGRISHASSITLGGTGRPLEIPECTVMTASNVMYCPLQEYLLGSAVELPEKSAVSVPKKENRTSLGELFEKHKAEEIAENKGKRGEKRGDKDGDKTVSMNLMKKLLMKKKSSTTRGTAETGSVETKLCKILQKFHKKVHPEELLPSDKSNKMHKIGTGIKDMMVCNGGYYKDDHGFPNGSTGRNGYTLCRKSTSNPAQFTDHQDEGDSNGSRECWINTDENYLVLEL